MFCGGNVTLFLSLYLFAAMREREKGEAARQKPHGDREKIQVPAREERSKLRGWYQSKANNTARCWCDCIMASGPVSHCLVTSYPLCSFIFIPSLVSYRIVSSEHPSKIARSTIGEFIIYIKLQLLTLVLRERKRYVSYAYRRKIFRDDIQLQIDLVPVPYFSTKKLKLSKKKFLILQYLLFKGKILYRL